VGRLSMNIAAMALASLLVSCYSYQEVPVERKFAAGAPDRMSVPVYRLSVKKYFTRLRSFTPVAAINNRAVELAAQGRFGEAEILFREAVAEDAGEPAGYNNLGIVCEIAGRRDEAFRMYMTALRLLPGNAAFKKNFSSFADHGNGVD
jgi:tetratricopeptide (TPR) repeat protein